MAKDWMINNKGENNYAFHWKDENDRYCGFNDVWASNMKEARKRAKLNETKAHWALYDNVKGEYITVPNKVEGKGHCFRMEGMYIDPKSFKRSTVKSSLLMDTIANMITC